MGTEIIETASSSATRELLNYGVLGVIAVAFFLLLFWILKNTKEEKKSIMDALDKERSDHLSSVEKFTNSTLENAKVIDKLAIVLEQHLKK